MTDHPEYPNVLDEQDSDAAVSLDDDTPVDAGDTTGDTVEDAAIEESAPPDEESQDDAALEDEVEDAATEEATPPVPPDEESEDDNTLEDEPEDAAEMPGRDELRMALYAMLFSSDRPLSSSRLAEALGEDVDVEIVQNLMDELAQSIEGKELPYVLREIAGGYQLSTKPEYAPYIRNLFQVKKSKGLSRSALETLAIIAYKQPVTRGEVEAIRGVSVSHAFDLLQEKRLIKVVGVAELPGRPKLYRTTEDFLIHFGIKSIKELPSLEELRELD